MSACPCPHYPIGCHGHPAERRAEYWKAEHLAGNERIAALSRLLERAVNWLHLADCTCHKTNAIKCARCCGLGQLLRDVAVINSPVDNTELPK